MSSLNISVKNVISFQRLDTQYCTHYEIYRFNNNGDKVLIDAIINPKQPCKTRRTKVLEYNDCQEWFIDKAVVRYNTEDMVVTVNGTKIPPTEYMYYSNKNVLKLLCKINKKDLVSIEYFVDMIEYVDIYMGEQPKYQVIPVFTNDYSIGGHTILNWR